MRRRYVLAGAAILVRLLVGRRRLQDSLADAIDVGTPERVAAYSEPVLAAAREELVRADTKASILLAATATVIAAIIAGAVAGDWSPSSLTGWRELMWWAGTAVVGIAVLLLAAAIYPRSRRRGGRPDAVTYYGDVVMFKDYEELRTALERSAPRNMDRLTDQVYQVGRIATRKYRLLALGMWALLSSVVMCSLAVMFEALR